MLGDHTHLSNPFSNGLIVRPNCLYLQPHLVLGHALGRLSCDPAHGHDLFLDPGHHVQLLFRDPARAVVDRHA